MNNYKELAMQGDVKAQHHWLALELVEYDEAKKNELDFFERYGSWLEHGDDVILETAADKVAEMVQLITETDLKLLDVLGCIVTFKRKALKRLNNKVFLVCNLARIPSKASYDKWAEKQASRNRIPIPYEALSEAFWDSLS
jgi:hypothetical protein